jgi:hypothetical protein
MTARQPSRRRLFGWPAAALVAACLPRSARAHAFPVDGFTVLHPWCAEARTGATDLPVLLRIVDIRQADRLLGAQTPVATRRPFDPPAPQDDPSPPGLPLQPGVDLNLTPFGAHLLLQQVLTDLHFGREYPLTLRFEKAGDVEAALIIGLD